MRAPSWSDRSRRARARAMARGRRCRAPRCAAGPRRRSPATPHATSPRATTSPRPSRSPRSTRARRLRPSRRGPASRAARIVRDGGRSASRARRPPTEACARAGIALRGAAHDVHERGATCQLAGDRASNGLARDTLGLIAAPLGGANDEAVDRALVDLGLARHEAPALRTSSGIDRKRLRDNSARGSITASVPREVLTTARTAPPISSACSSVA